MAHEMTQTDDAVFHRVPAWHGNGIVVPDAWTPSRAAREIMPYTVNQKTLSYVINGERVVCESHVINVRSDTNEELGIVSDNYVPIQNEDAALFCEALNDQKKVQIESAGTIRGGKKIWFLLKGEPFEVAIGDTIAPYILISNGHDGVSSFRVTPTTVRVVCSNTMHLVIPDKDTGELGKSAISINHTKNVMQRVQDAQHALSHYNAVMKRTREEVMEPLAKMDVNSAQVQQFFLDSYTADFGEIPMNPQTKVEQNRRDKSLSAYASFSKRFDDEKSIAGTSMWCAFNAYSGIVQHDQKARGKDDVARIERRVESNLFGLNQGRTQDALERAFQFALAG